MHKCKCKMVIKWWRRALYLKRWFGCLAYRSGLQNEQICVHEFIYFWGVYLCNSPISCYTACANKQRYLHVQLILWGRLMFGPISVFANNATGAQTGNYCQANWVNNFNTMAQRKSTLSPTSLQRCVSVIGQNCSALKCHFWQALNKTDLKKDLQANTRSHKRLLKVKLTLILNICS